jgi:bifunctional non-homologous end joining protein LigD
MKKTTVVRLDGKPVKLSNLEKVLYPGGNYTKAQILDYYRQAAPYMLPHLRNRPLTLKRYPDGADKGSFYEKRCPAYRPEWVATAELPGSTKPLNACLVNDLSTLIWVANLASLELHVPLARVPAIGRPDLLVFDLDPGAPADIGDCARLALQIKELLSPLGLSIYVKSSGKKGLHLYVPLNAAAMTYERTKSFSKALAQALERRYPERVTARMAKQHRSGKVFVNWSQNDPSKTMVCVYSLRAAEEPQVAFPLSWQQVETLAGRPRGEPFAIVLPQALERLKKEGDLFEPLLTQQQELPEVKNFQL